MQLASYSCDPFRCVHMFNLSACVFVASLTRWHARTERPLSYRSSTTTTATVTRTDTTKIIQVCGQQGGDANDDETERTDTL